MFLLLFVSCRNLEDESQEDIRRAQIVKEWQIDAVTDESGNSRLAGNPGDVIITFTETNFSFNAGGLEFLPNENDELFPSGTWRFANETLNEVIIDDGSLQAEITIIQLSVDSFVFSYTGAEPKANNTFQATVEMSPVN